MTVYDRGRLFAAKDTTSAFAARWPRIGLRQTPS